MSELMQRKWLERFMLYRDLKGLAGFAIDLASLARMQFQNPHGLTKFYAIDSVRRQTGAETFIEAGTARGTTAARCSRVFKRVFTIELDTNLAIKSRQFLKQRRNVSVIEGDAQRAIPRIIEEHQLDRIVLFLDGHAPLGAPPSEVAAEPAIEVLGLLCEYRKRISGVIVDDFRNFGAAPGFPPRSSLLKAAEDFCAAGEFVFTVQLDQLVIVRRSA